MGRLGFEVVFKKDIMQVIVPTWRSTGDVSIPADIIEEIARIYGFENFEPQPITITFNGAINQKEVDLDRKIREYLAFRCGMQEVYSYPWIKEKYINALSLNVEEMLSLTTPPSPDEKYLRSSLLPNLCKAVSGNLRFFNEFSIFESSQILLNKNYTSLNNKLEILPSQQRNIAGAFVNVQENINNLFKKSKGILEMLPRYTHIEPLTFENIEKPSWADSIVWLNIVYNGEIVGNLALLSKKAAMDCGIKNSAVMLFELNIEALRPYSSRTNKFYHLPEYPMTDYDISLLFEEKTKWADIINVINEKCKNELIHNISFIEEYKGNQVPTGKKSVTLRLQIGSDQKTLTANEIENCATSVVKELGQVFSAKLRS
jgi:phenylalanyl-tRNA synthetase beta chain